MNEGGALLLMGSFSCFWSFASWQDARDKTSNSAALLQADRVCPVSSVSAHTPFTRRAQACPCGAMKKTGRKL